MKVSVKYSKCHSNKKCICAIYLRVDDSFPRYVFSDFCYGSSNTSLDFKYFDNDLINKDVLMRGNFPLLDCNKTINNENNETQWKQINFYQNYFKCAQLAGKGLAVIYFVFNLFVGAIAKYLSQTRILSKA